MPDTYLTFTKGFIYFFSFFVIINDFIFNLISRALYFAKFSYASFHKSPAEPWVLVGPLRSGVKMFPGCWRPAEPDWSLRVCSGVSLGRQSTCLKALGPWSQFSPPPIILHWARPYALNDKVEIKTQSSSDLRCHPSQNTHLKAIAQPGGRARRTFSRWSFMWWNVGGGNIFADYLFPRPGKSRW